MNDASRAPEGRNRTATCPQCGQPSQLDAGNRWRPFCSERCKMIDLGAWFSGERSIPSEEPPDSMELEPQSRRQ